MRKIKVIFKDVNWLRVIGWITGLSSVIYLFGGLALLVEYGSWVDMDFFAPLFCCGLSFGVFLWLSYMSSVTLDDAKFIEKVRSSGIEKMVDLKITRCKGEGQGVCKGCLDNGKRNANWMCFLYKIEGMEGCYCLDCVKKIAEGSHDAEE